MLIFLQDCKTEEERTLVAKLYDQYSRRLIWQAMKILKNQQDAEDAVQKAFLKIIDIMPAVLEQAESDPNAVLGYLSVTTKNVCLDELRRRVRWRMKIEGSLDDDSIFWHPIDTNITLTNDDYRYELLKSGLTKLKIHDRWLFYSRYAEQFRIKEIAKMENKKANTIKSRLARGRAKLKIMIKEMIKHEQQEKEV